MQFYDLLKTTLLDYPGEVAATLFTFGCNLRCPYCHNPELVLADLKPTPLEWEIIANYLKKRSKVLSGVCITGGEPLINDFDEFKFFVDKIHSLGLKVKLDTNGTFPDKLKKLPVDFIAMDIKTSLYKYNLVGKVPDIEEKIKESINYIKICKIDYEFRTTVVPNIVTIDDIYEITTYLTGAKKYILAQFRPTKTLNPDWVNKESYPIKVLEEMKQIVIDAGISCELRADY